MPLTNCHSRDIEPAVQKLAKLLLVRKVADVQVLANV